MVFWQAYSLRVEMAFYFSTTFRQFLNIPADEECPFYRQYRTIAAFHTKVATPRYRHVIRTFFSFEISRKLLIDESWAPSTSIDNIVTSERNEKYVFNSVQIWSLNFVVVKNGTRNVDSGGSFDLAFRADNEFASSQITHAARQRYYYLPWQLGVRQVSVISR